MDGARLQAGRLGCRERSVVERVGLGDCCPAAAAEVALAAALGVGGQVFLYGPAEAGATGILAVGTRVNVLCGLRLPRRGGAGGQQEGVKGQGAM